MLAVRRKWPGNLRLYGDCSHTQLTLLAPTVNKQRALPARLSTLTPPNRYLSTDSSSSAPVRRRTSSCPLSNTRAKARRRTCSSSLSRPNSTAPAVFTSASPRAFSTSYPAMAATKIDGTAIAKKIRERLAAEIVDKQKINPRYKPCLKIIQGVQWSPEYF
ncbi:uncharacterized protein BCR38DRAFT_139150 [Pseudomassariella vexata]|uniref:Uncharacterized protein n=1 Tax=Pseudomassariella vexata TaxID=1141098 RepID=A0A1Y2EBX2_9PEZI|nr:uncharacterized protein BCR38DRAFT_139150 [Pseudomassariella vexata]ORY68804.1 hypothetical protein BCR38DRAFT_139150 [Pseudomassariella vexata]